MKRLTFLILCLEAAILSFNVGASSAVVPSLAKDLGVSSFAAGRIVWFYMLPYGLAALFYAPLLKIFNAKAIEIFCFTIFSLANLVVGLAKNLTFLCWGRFLMGVFGASVIPLALILIAGGSLPRTRGRLVGIFFSFSFLASLLGIFLSGFLYWRFLFIIPGLLGLLLLCLMSAGLPNFYPPSEAGTNYLSFFKQKRLLSFFTYIFLISIFYHGTQQWLGVYFSERFNFSQTIISMLITLTSLSGIFGEALGGYLADILGRFKTINLGLSLMVISVFLLIFRFPLGLFALILIIWGLGWTFNHAGLSTLLTDLPERFLKEAASLNSSVRFLSGGIGSLLGGLVLEKSFEVGFFAFGFSLLLILFFSPLFLDPKI